MGFFLSVCLCVGLNWQILICLTVCASLEYSILVHGRLCFWWVLGFGLQVFYWVLLHLCSWGKLVWNSLCWVCVVWVSWWLWTHKINLTMFLLFLSCGIIWGVLILALIESMVEFSSKHSGPRNFLVWGVLVTASISLGCVWGYRSI